MNEADISAGRPRARKRGCVLKGCLVIFIVVMLMGVILGSFGTYLYYGFVPFLSQGPVPIKIYPATDAQYQAVLAKVEPFNQAVEAGIEKPLELTADDLDILIARDPAWADWRGRLYLAIVDNELVVDVSTSANEPETPELPLYFSGRLTMGASIAGGEFTAVMRRITTLSGRPLTGLLARLVTSPGFALSFDDTINRRIKDNSYLARGLAGLRTASIEHNRILVISAGEPAPPPTPTPAPTPAESPQPAATVEPTSSPTPVAAPAGPA